MTSAPLHSLLPALALVSVLTACQPARAGGAPSAPPISTPTRSAAQAAHYGTQTAHVFEQVVTSAAGSRQTIRLNYLLFLPPGFGSDTRKHYPLILYLHGAGESGNDVQTLKRHALPRYVEGMPDFPFIVLSPQAPVADGWQPQFAAVRALLDHALKTLPVDRQRVYLTGNSMGGNGTWDLARQSPDRFAAILPVASYYLGPLDELCALKTTPVWVIHGERDEGIPAADADDLVQTLRACGGTPKFTLLPETTHVATNDIYADPDLYRWLLQQENTRLRVVVTTPTVPRR